MKSAHPLVFTSDPISPSHTGKATCLCPLLSDHLKRYHCPCIVQNHTSSTTQNIYNIPGHTLQLVLDGYHLPPMVQWSKVLDLKWSYLSSLYKTTSTPVTVKQWLCRPWTAGYKRITFTTTCKTKVASHLCSSVVTCTSQMSITSLLQESAFC